LKFSVQGAAGVERSASEFILVPNSWDDFSYRTTFVLRQKGEAGEPRSIGTVKIVEKSPNRAEDGKFRPSIPEAFEELGPRFVSLGQDEDYYRTLLKFVGRERAGEVLSSLSDISWNPDTSALSGIPRPLLKP
jgi:hypothetical protein